MSKRLLALVLALITLFLAGCNGEGGGSNEENGSGEDGESNSNIQLSEGEAVFKARVTATDNDRLIEAEIIDSDIAFGLYWVLTSDLTSYYGPDGQAIERKDISIGNTIEIVFSGQVMMSYPPQIAAKRIYKQ